MNKPFKQNLCKSVINSSIFENHVIEGDSVNCAVSYLETKRISVDNELDGLGPFGSNLFASR